MIGGVAGLQRDLTQLTGLQKAVKDKQLGEVLRLYKIEYATPLISELAKKWCSEQLPEMKNLARYQGGSECLAGRTCRDCKYSIAATHRTTLG